MEDPAYLDVLSDVFDYRLWDLNISEIGVRRLYIWSVTLLFVVIYVFIVTVFSVTQSYVM